MSTPARTARGRDLERLRDRSFGLTFGGIAGLVAAWNLWRARPAIALGLFAVSAALIAIALTSPRLLRVPSAIWWTFAAALGWFNSRVLLTAIFFLVLTPVGLLRRVMGHDPLRRRRGTATWVPYPERLRGNPKHYERMF